MLVFFYELIFHRCYREKMLASFLEYKALVVLYLTLASRVKFHLLRRFDALSLEMLLFRLFQFLAPAMNRAIRDPQLSCNLCDRLPRRLC